MKGINLKYLYMFQLFINTLCPFVAFHIYLGFKYQDVFKLHTRGAFRVLSVS